MITTASRSRYICQLCRIRLTPPTLHRARPLPVRATAVAAAPTARSFSSTTAALQSSIFDSEFGGDAPVKRRPGRPRKDSYNNDSIVAPQSSNFNSEFGQDAPVKRRPGRPPKSSYDNDSSQRGSTPSIRRGPGRPSNKKFTTPDEDVPWDTPTPMNAALARSLAAEAEDMAKYEQSEEYDAETFPEGARAEAEEKARLAEEEAAHRAAMASQLGDILSSSVNKGARKDRVRGQSGLALPPASFLGDNYDVEFSNLPGTRWRTLGMRDVVVDTMMRVFPEATRPTYTQVRLLPPLIRGNSVLVNDLPGTGKSFAIALWLLTLDRAMKQRTEGKKGQTPTTTALVLLPNIDLVQQYHGLILDLLKKTGSDAINQNTDSFVQALYRSTDKEADMIQRLRDNPSPHILIATPTILLDFLSAPDESLKDLLDFFSLKAIVADEIDTTIAHYTDEDGNAVFSLGDKKKKKKKQQEEKQNPIALLLDWIFKARRVHSFKHHLPPTQPQLVISSSAVGRMRIFKTIQSHHRSWFEGDRRPGFNVLQTELSAAAKPVFVNSRSNDPLNKNKILPLIPDTVTHHVVAYDLDTGALRDAPVPEFDTPEMRFKRLREFDEEQQNLISEFEEAMEQGDNARIGELLQHYEQASQLNARTGYPAPIAANILEKLLQHDNHPRHVLAAVGEAASQKDLVEELNRRGIRAFQLHYDVWNEHNPVRMGRTDQLLGITGGPDKARKEEDAAEGGKPETTVWVTNYHSCRGLDTPGISHAYILHRVKKVREYVTYGGRVARWPYTSEQEQLRDPRALGKDIRPKGKLVSVVLEGRRGMEGVSVVRKSGREGEGMSEGEMYAWEMEAVRIAKCGVGKKAYFVEEEEVKEEVEKVEETGGDKGELEEAAKAAGRSERAAVEHEEAAREQERELLKEEGLEMENDGENVSEEIAAESEVEGARDVEQEEVLKKKKDDENVSEEMEEESKVEEELDVVQEEVLKKD